LVAEAESRRYGSRLIKTSDQIFETLIAVARTAAD
jgi:hypothetical protein